MPPMNMSTYARPCTGLGVLVGVGVGVGVGVERRGRALTCTGVIHGSLSPCISLYLAASRYISLHLAISPYTCTGVIHGSLRVRETTEEPSSTETDATCTR